MQEETVVSHRLITKYFPDITEHQLEQFRKLQELYMDWNSRINVISRKDIDLLYERHVLHSMAIAKVIQFKSGTRILDVGTGGGFPGIPLAILFPESRFYLVDSIGKKIKVVQGVAEALGLKNVKAEQKRVEELKETFDFVVSRAVTTFSVFYAWVRNKFSKDNFNDLPNGILYLKGGDLEEELKEFEKRIKVYPIKYFFEEEFFETKKIVFLPAGK